MTHPQDAQGAAAAALDDDDDVPLELQIERARKLLEQQSNPRRKKKGTENEDDTPEVVRKDKWGQIIQYQQQKSNLDFGNPYTKQGAVGIEDALASYEKELELEDGRGGGRDAEPEAFKVVREKTQTKVQAEQDAAHEARRQTKAYRLQKKFKKNVVKRFKPDVQVSASSSEACGSVD